MSPPFDIVCLSTDHWGPVARRRRHLMQSFVSGGYVRSVLFVEPATTLQDAVQRCKDPACLAAVARSALNARPIATDIAAMTPFLPVPFILNRVVRAINTRLSVPTIRRAMHRMGIRNPVLWISHPIYAPYLAHLDGRLIVCDRTDEWSFMPDNPHPERTKQEEFAMILRADLVFAVSQSLLQEALRYNKPAFLLPNAVDLSHFTGIPDASAERSRPDRVVRIGYVGHVWPERLDIEFIRAVATRRPGYIFELLGPVHHSFQRRAFSDLPNVVLLGTRPYEALPSYLSTCDAAWIPHRVNPLTNAMNPLKVWEYLAMGLPVVSTRVAGVEAFGDIVSIAATPDEACVALDRLIESNDPSQYLRRRNAVQQHTWRARAAEASVLIQSALVNTART